MTLYVPVEGSEVAVIRLPNAAQWTFPLYAQQAAHVTVGLACRRIEPLTNVQSRYRYDRQGLEIPILEHGDAGGAAQAFSV